MAKEQLYSVPGLHQAVTTTPTHAAGTDATADYGVWRAPCDCKVVSIYQFFNTAITGADTDSRTLSFLDGGAAGTGTAAITGASVAYESGVDATTAAPIDMSPDSPYELDEGDILVYRNELVGSGLAAAVPMSVVQIAFRAV